MTLGTRLSLQRRMTPKTIAFYHVRKRSIRVNMCIRCIKALLLPLQPPLGPTPDRGTLAEGAVVCGIIELYTLYHT